MREQLRPLIYFALLLGGVMFLGAIVWSGYLSITESAKPTLPSGVSDVLTIIGGALATIFGATLGIAKFSDGTARAVRATTRTGFTWPNVSLWATYLYFAGLVAMLVILLFDQDSANAAQPVQDGFKTLIGAIGGLFYIEAGIKQS